MSEAQERWFGFDCPACGTVWDVRAVKLDEVLCPKCDATVRFSGSWESDQGGFGSRGDLEARVADLRQQLAEACACRFGSEKTGDFIVKHAHGAFRPGHGICGSHLEIEERYLEQIELLHEEIRALKRTFAALEKKVRS